MDLLVSLVAFSIFFPVLLVFAILLFFSNQGSPFFIQSRPGKGGKLFKIIKLKTMSDTRGPDGVLLSDEQRLTKIGAIIRKTSLDELPQILNVIKGEMSLIGPRPLLPEYLPLYSAKQSRRHLVKPGITGWAQVNGRNALSWDNKLSLDTWYVDNLNFALDIKILFMTIKKVLKRDGISSGSSVTTEKFKGS